MKEKKIKAAILGCTGIVGQQFVRMLAEHPYFDLALLVASEESAGKIYGEVVKWMAGGQIPSLVFSMPVIDLSSMDSHIEEIDVIFSALPSSLAGEVEEKLRSAGKFVFSNASSHRMDPDVPIVLAEVNPEHLELIKVQKSKYGGFIVTNSNCVVAGLAMVLKPLMSFSPKAMVVSTYQSVSGAGLEGLYAMEIMDNLIPFIEKEEEKVVRETRKILGELAGEEILPASLEIYPSCCRVPVREGHLESLTIEFDREVEEEDLKEVLRNFEGLPQKLQLPSAPEKPVILLDENNRPQPLLDLQAGGKELKRSMAVSVGRLRKQGRRISLFLLVHNTIRGAAGSSVLNAELAFKLGYMG